MTKTYHQPTLPLFYFDNDRTPTQAKETANDAFAELPPELLSFCFSKFANWGDLAKLAQVQKSWSTILNDASDQSSESKWELAQAFLNGTCGLVKNEKRAVSIMKELSNVQVEADEEPKLIEANMGCFAPAVRVISKCYFAGTGVDAESKLGLAWLKAAFLLGDDVDAAYEIALTYEYGHHNVQVDVVAAAHWFKIAAEKGHVEAMAELGLCYELGCGLEQNDEEALDWYTKAANLGHVTSKFSVGEAFEEARGVPQSDEEACLWYYRAALAGDEDSKKSLRRLYDIARIVVPGVAGIFND